MARLSGSLPVVLADATHVVLRVGAGLLFIQHGLQKLFGLLGGRVAAMDSLLGLAGVLELAGGTLLVLGLLTRPVAFVLTDGSGGNGASRLRGSSALLANLGARAGPLFGRHTDRELYGHLLRGEHAPFLAWAAELVECLRAEAVDCLVADPADGHNPLHDVCRLIADRAVAVLRGEGREVESLAFVLVEARPLPSPDPP